MKITAESARKALADAVALKGADYVYINDDTQDGDNCVYFLEDTGDGKPTPSCLVGHVFAAHGIFDVQEGANPTGHDPELFQNPNVAWALTYAQHVQDGGKSWGDAVKAFEGRVNG